MRVKIVLLDRCIGCKSCEIACAVEHSQTKQLFSSIFEQPRPQKRIEVAPSPGLTTFPVTCRQCDPAPCVDICPAGAISREADVNLIDPDRCRRCWMCLIVCPFSIIQVDRSSSKALKCDDCIERKREGREPACVEACPTKALRIEETEDMTLFKIERMKVADTVRKVSRGEPVERVPVSIKIWRDFGEEITKLKEEVR